MLPARLELVPLDGHNYAVMEERTGRDLVHLFYEGLAPTAPADGAIVLPREDGRASSTLVAQGMCSGAAAGLPRLRNSIEEAVPWRRQYRGAMEELSWFDAPERGASCAQAGLDALAEILHFADGRPLSEAAIVRPASGGGVIRGSGGAGDARPELRVELDGKSYSGQALADLLGRWDGASRLQPDAYATLAHLAEDPGELTFDGLTFVCLGAGAELSPSRQLLQWGADVAAVIRPGSERRAELLELAQAGTGTLYLPPDDAADISVEPERVAGWIADLPGKLVMVDSLYAPGAAFLIAAAGADVVERLVCRARPDTVLAWIGTPTDSYRLETTGIRRQLGEGPAAKAVAGYAAVRRVRPGRIGGVYPGFVDVQGPNYAAAKRIARWRATVERAAGRTVSFNVGPMSLTSSVTNNAILRTAYAGLDRLGMPPLPPEVSATLMAALLLWDLHYPEAVQESDTFLTDKAIDCGFFSSPYEPNGLMEAAVALGAGDTVASGVRKLLRR